MAKNEGRSLTMEAIRILAENDGKIWRSELRDAVEQKVDPERKGEKEPSGRPRWVGQLDSFAARYAKDIIRKEKRFWFLTSAGKALAYDAQGDPLSVSEITERFTSWLANNQAGKAAPAVEADSLDGGGDDDAQESQEPEDSQAQLGDDIVEYIKNQDPKNTGIWFENLVVALLRGMGYQYVDRRGKSGDGGVDVVAYKDKLGAMPPRIKVQAKHNKGDSPTPISEEVLQRLASSVHDGEIGMCVTSSTKFSKSAEIYARTCGKHLELVNIDRLVELWAEHYPNVLLEDQKLMPLKYELKYSLDTSRIKKKGDAD